jgi:Sulfotransferase domain
LDRTLDFVVIGAQKAATTTLHQYLRAHSRLALPVTKEAPFFHVTEDESGDWDDFVATNFPNAESRLWGKVTPQYMCYPEVSARRLHAHNPNLKVLAILRNPIDRAYSHFRMSLRRGVETRRFEDAVEQLMTPTAGEEARSSPTESNAYLAWSEYARQLRCYFDRFPKAQRRIYFTEDFEADPRPILDDIQEFFDLDYGFDVRVMRRDHKGGVRPRFPTVEDAKRVRTVSAIWRRVPNRVRLRLRPLFYWYGQWNVVREAPAALPSGVRRRLVDHFRADVDDLLEMVERWPPWPEFTGVTRLAGQAAKMEPEIP